MEERLKNSFSVFPSVFSRRGANSPSLPKKDNRSKKESQNMKSNKEKIFTIILIVALIFSLFTIYVYSNDTQKFKVSARACALYEPQTETFIYQKNENSRLSMASTTKIMTAIIAIENSEPDEIIHVDDRAIGIEGSSVYLEKGEALTAKSLVYALMLRSANDAAAALAYEISGGISEFADLMNDKAQELGLTDTNFKNPHGLDAEGHYTTAHDLAILSAYALKNPTFKEIVSTKKAVIDSSLKSRLIMNHNKLLSYYDGCIGVKTGYTKKSGRSLVGAAEKDGLTLISVTIDAPDDWADHKKLLDYGFSVMHSVTLIEKGEYNASIPVIDGTKSTLSVENGETVKIILKGAVPNITRKIELERFAVAPISKGDKIGTIIFKNGDTEISRVDIIATEDIQKQKKKGLF